MKENGMSKHGKISKKDEGMNMYSMQVDEYKVSCDLQSEVIYGPLAPH